MRTSIATVCLSGTLEEKLDAVASAGFDGVEIFTQDLLVSPTAPEEVRARAADLGLCLDLYQPFRNGVELAPDKFDDALRRLRRTAELMNRLGTPTLLVCSNVSPDAVADDDLVAEQLHRMGEVAAEHGVRLAYEALAWGTHVNGHDHAHRLVLAADHPNVGTCLDSFHILSRGGDPASIQDMDGDKIFFVQLADAPLMRLDVLSWSRHHRVFPGEGDFDLVDVMTRLVRSGYSGPVSLEIFNDSFRQADVARTAVDGLRSLRWLEDRTRSAMAQELNGPDSPGAQGAAGATDRLQLQSLPRISAPAGWDFVELRTTDLGDTTRLLHRLGFRLGGHHRSKDVQVWLQGDVRVVVSEAGEGTRREPHLDPRERPDHRPVAEIAGLGFEVEEPAAAYQRALQLGSDPVDRSELPGEAVLRGVWAPDGTEVFFGPSPGSGVPAWLEEFGVESETAGFTDLITGIDHVNVAQKWQHYDEGVLFYTSVLALEATPAQEVPGPSGLVRSQVMRSPDDAVRMPLNLAPTAAEQGSFVGVAYPEHIALASTDVREVARRAMRRGLDFLTVPENYYEDLVTRFDLDPETVTELRELNLLYDRDEHGEFLHFYTRTLGDLFMEVVERRGYRGFGAEDAPVRLAAQYRLQSREPSAEQRGA
ncbi:sugar phosphate isomerase/epimerase and 4-hydroxyphenylpyruvate domain-containing protein [Kocuria sp. JC486]|uniref:bifunctional sugar phosphate isomerase/epimerase/4-hydroxyphenylpyruvate dioxygenase family protein n=1 Tax=Kocuria sp. JC486 TaxID=1970736 RepID=UPI001420399F|nr:sugar phosphate isomerase/epimerase and 4-hydroxyphenylpyruvate domain-containing protein [Kocuria sp. JC486]NHU85834.1 sugar phosphate isomerase/epimerase and 4-hydroxyphenylpyruvate domain-containing protein [Kocuria sp. JC486]